MRLAETAEMIHTASLLHDDAVDCSSLRRGFPSAPTAFGNKLAVLSGTFVLGRATTALSRLGDDEVTDLMTSAVSDLVEGELLQIKETKTADTDSGGQKRGPSADDWRIYLQKTYMKTASLIAKSARAAVTLGGCKEGDIWREIAYAYGRNLGIAFQVCIFVYYRLLNCLTSSLQIQLADDMLDYESIDTTLGKPSGADLQLGLATAPALYAWEEYPEMGDLIQRKFRNPGDVELVMTTLH
jgi:hexaprenyl-diphosphate synthase